MDKFFRFNVLGAENLQELNMQLRNHCIRKEGSRPKERRCEISASATAYLQHVHVRPCEGDLGAGVDENMQQLRLNMQVHRRLCQAVTNPDLDSFSRNARGATPAVDA